MFKNVSAECVSNKQFILEQEVTQSNKNGIYVHPSCAWLLPTAHIYSKFDHVFV